MATSESALEVLTDNVQDESTLKNQRNYAVTPEHPTDDLPGESIIENQLKNKVPDTQETPASSQSKNQYLSVTDETTTVLNRASVDKAAEDYQRAIILLGKTGVGKKTLARHIFEDHANSFPEVGSVNSVTRKPIIFKHFDVDIGVNQDEKIKVRVVIMDTNGLGGPTTSEVLDRLKCIEKVSFIFFLLKYGRVTREDCNPFDDIIRKLSDDCRQICHLVVTGCEGQNESGREGITKLYLSDPMTQKLCSFVERKIIPVGFPDLKTLIPMVRELYKDGIINDKRALQKIVTRSKCSTFEIDQLVKTSKTNFSCSIL